MNRRNFERSGRGLTALVLALSLPNAIAYAEDSVVPSDKADGSSARTEPVPGHLPKLMFLVHEEYTGKDGKTTEIEHSTLQPLMEHALLEKGFDLVASDQLDKLRSQERQVFSSILTDDNAAAKVAMSFGAQYIVRARASVKYTSFNDLGLSEYHGFADVSLSAVNASSAQIVASMKETGTSPGNCFSEAELPAKTVAHVALPLLTNLMDRVLQSGAAEAREGIRYSIKVLGMTSTKKQVLPFISLLKKLKGVSEVKQVSFGDGRLEVELRYSSDVSELQTVILTATSDDKIFADLDARTASGREINFEMK